MILIVKILLLTLYLSCVNSVVKAQNASSFILYCSCMGRFGNQAEQLLGSLLFAKSLNRTLVLPPFVSYRTNHTATLVPFEDIIQVSPIKKYHDVITLDNFMPKYSETVWPRGKRRFYCYSNRDVKSDLVTCNVRQGEPSSTFWTRYDVFEDESNFYKPLTTSPKLSHEWDKRYPPSNHPVLAFTGAPTPFPAHHESIHIQKYIRLVPEIEQSSRDFRKRNDFLSKPYISMHLRSGSDWKKACDLLNQRKNLVQLFSSNQCTGYQSKTPLNFETCYPSYDTIKSSLKSALSDYESEEGRKIDVVHIATDIRDNESLRQLKMDFPQLIFIEPPINSGSLLDTMLDISLMIDAEIFIGNCISSFSAFPARVRSEQHFPARKTRYFGFNSMREPSINQEL